MQAIPLHEKIIVLPFPKKEVTSGGLFIPETSQERPSKATVVAVGNGTKDRVMEMKIGDVVGHIKNAGIEHIEEGIVYYILRDVDCHYRIPKD